MDITIPRILNPPTQSFFLFGPRGTGKTTWLKHHFPKAVFIDLLEADTFRSYSARPERLREAVLGSPECQTIIIDEIQKIPELLPEVHSLIEKKTGRQFILTGSSSRKLKRSGTDLLAGRALNYHLHPFVACELGRDFDLNKALYQGLVPLVVCSTQPENVLKSYVALYVREEVQMEGLVRNIGNFSRFLEAVSFSHGSVLNISNVARECEVQRKTVESYISILEDLMLAYRIPVFTKKSKRKLVLHPKFYYFDTGVFRSLRPAGPLDSPETIEGPAFEGLVAQQLWAWADYQNERPKLYFWRTPSGTEVDFVLYGKNIFQAIEVKNVIKVRREHLKGLKAFRTDYPQSTVCLVYRGRERLMIDNIPCIPCEEFLKNQNIEEGTDESDLSR